ncbi:hypothetical protein V495_03631 [Pseudogymnoascus sp. VKM F-4514 (FW-929)]|nr:hypothetical protein V495_03631 [Pseudogymnoascus sp. VKM F-4514 (FW-929)]KFY56744.1 hypothetical protein V497_06021 [Pseudogymnoascus sp. VKM F-4516 (FW-969)]
MEFVPKSEIEVLSQEISDDFGSYRIRAGQRVHYVTITANVFDDDTMCRPHMLIPQLPNFLDKEWTTMEVIRKPDGSLASELSIEHETYTYSAIEEYREPGDPVISPAFLGHVTENGRVIGMLLEKLEGEFASMDDLPACRDALKNFHLMNIVHGDVNRYNFIVDRSKKPVHVRLVDFEYAEPYEESKAVVEL